MSNGPLHHLVAEHLRSHPGERLTVQQIAQGLITRFPGRFADKERSLQGRTTLLDQLTREIYAQKNAILQNSPDVVVDRSRRPLRLFIESGDGAAVLSKAIELKIDEPQEKGASVDIVTDEDRDEERSEHSLYQPLQRFLFNELGIVTKRINESTSSNRRGKNGNKWLHPDIVGMVAPGRQWMDIVRQCSMALPTRKAKLISIEVKLRLTSSDVREAFFQAVSNSLWANLAYLAAVEIKGEDTYDELSMLCALHGIGFISIDTDNFSESRVAIPPREREEIDWASANRIAAENRDFRTYLQNVLNYLQTGHLVESLWDRATHSQEGFGSV